MGVMEMVAHLVGLLVMQMGLLAMETGLLVMQMEPTPRMSMHLLTLVEMMQM